MVASLLAPSSKRLGRARLPTTSWLVHLLHDHGALLRGKIQHHEHDKTYVTNCNPALEKLQAAKGCIEQGSKSSASGSDNDVQESQVLKEKRKSRRELVAEAYNIRKAHVHAELWQQEILKHGREQNEESNDNVVIGTKSTPYMGEEKWTTLWNAKLNKAIPQDWEGFQADEECYDEGAEKEEALLQAEFARRKERNKLQIASFVKQHLYGRHRSVEGWKYLVNSFFPETRRDNFNASNTAQLEGRREKSAELNRSSSKRKMTY